MINPDAVVIVSPADHLILKQDLFAEEIKKALEIASSENALITLGIKPNRPETGYGYIQAGTKKLSGKPDNLRRVKTFTEKPDKIWQGSFLKAVNFTGTPGFLSGRWIDNEGIHAVSSRD
jgi:mannose-1-phosphate guanylyltransferase